MFTNLIESQSHRKDLTRRGRFVMMTAGAYAILFFAAGIASIYAYDAQLDSQSTSLELLYWVPPVKNEQVQPERPQPPRGRSAANNTGRITPQPVRPIAYESPSNPTKVPDAISTNPNPIPPAPPNTRIGDYVGNPPTPPGGSGGCDNCTGNNSGSTIVRIPETTPPPPPLPVKPTQKVSQGVLIAHAVSLPQPVYPIIAKQIRAQGTVNVQILVDEQGRVISAQPVNGHPTLLTAAKEAALRARFTPTLLSGQPVKVQGVITYNFVLQ